MLAVLEVREGTVDGSEKLYVAIGAYECKIEIEFSLPSSAWKSACIFVVKYVVLEVKFRPVM